MESSDRDRVLRTLDGDGEAYAGLINAYQGMVFAVAMSVTGNYCDSEDVAQEAFLKAYQKLRTLANPSKFGAWLYTLTKRLAWRFVKARRARATSNDETVLSRRADARAESPVEAAARRELNELLWKHVGDLAPKTREAILLYYVEGFTIKRTAQFLGIRQGAMKMRLRAGRDRLRGTLMKEVEVGLRRSRPSNKLCGAVLAALPAGGVPSVAPAAGLGSAQALVGLLAVAKAKAVVIAACVLLVLGGTSFLVRNAGRGPGGGPAPAPVVDRPQPETSEERTAKEREAAKPAPPARIGRDVALQKPAKGGAPRGAAEGNRDADAKEEAAPTPVPPEPGSITGWVADQDDLPLKGASIYKVQPPWVIKSFEDFKPELLATADADGKYRIDSMPAGNHQLAAHLEGYALPLIWNQNPRAVAVEPGGALEDVDFRLRKAFSISGQVVDHKHEPLAGAVVAIHNVKTVKGHQPILSRAAATDETGAYVLSDLPNGDYEVGASLPGFARDRKSDIPAGSSDVDFVLGKESGVSGRVTIRETGEPVSGVTIVTPH